MYEGNFLPMSVDFATMIPMLEMAGVHSRYISSVTYIYNDANAESFFHDHALKQREISQLIRSYPKYEPLDSIEF